MGPHDHLWRLVLIVRLHSLHFSGFWILAHAQFYRHAEVVLLYCQHSLAAVGPGAVINTGT